LLPRQSAAVIRERVATGSEIIISSVLILICGSLIPLARRLVAIRPRLIPIRSSLVAIRPRLIVTTGRLIAIMCSASADPTNLTVRKLGATRRATRSFGHLAAG
jgi:hypothetical protein